MFEIGRAVFEFIRYNIQKYKYFLFVLLYYWYDMKYGKLSYKTYFGAIAIGKGSKK